MFQQNGLYTNDCQTEHHARGQLHIVTKHTTKIEKYYLLTYLIVVENFVYNNHIEL